MSSEIQNMTKEQKDEYSKRKREEMRKKNEAYEKRHQEVLADRIFAEQRHSSVTTACSIKIGKPQDISRRKQKKNNDEEWRAERKLIDEQRVARNSGNFSREWDKGKSEKGFNAEEEQTGRYNAYSRNWKHENFSSNPGRRYQRGWQYAREPAEHNKNSKFDTSSRRNSGQKRDFRNEAKSEFNFHDRGAQRFENEVELAEKPFKRENYMGKSGTRIYNKTIAIEESDRAIKTNDNVQDFGLPEKSFYYGRRSYSNKQQRSYRSGQNVSNNFDYHGRQYSNSNNRNQRGKYREHEFENSSTFYDPENDERNFYSASNSKSKAKVSNVSSDWSDSNVGRHYNKGGRISGSVNNQRNYFENKFSAQKNRASGNWIKEKEDMKSFFEDKLPTRKQTSGTWSDDDDEGESVPPDKKCWGSIKVTATNIKILAPNEGESVPPEKKCWESIKLTATNVNATDIAALVNPISGTWSDEDTTVPEKEKYWKCSKSSCDSDTSGTLFKNPISQEFGDPLNDKTTMFSPNEISIAQEDKSWESYDCPSESENSEITSALLNTLESQEKDSENGLSASLGENLCEASDLYSSCTNFGAELFAAQDLKTFIPSPSVYSSIVAQKDASNFICYQESQTIIPQTVAVNYFEGNIPKIPSDSTAFSSQLHSNDDYVIEVSDPPLLAQSITQVNDTIFSSPYLILQGYENNNVLNELKDVSNCPMVAPCDASKAHQYSTTKQITPKHLFSTKNDTNVFPVGGYESTEIKNASTTIENYHSHSEQTEERKETLSDPCEAEELKIFDSNVVRPGNTKDYMAKHFQADFNELNVEPSSENFAKKSLQQCETKNDTALTHDLKGLSSKGNSNESDTSVSCHHSDLKNVQLSDKCADPVKHYIASMDYISSVGDTLLSDSSESSQNNQNVPNENPVKKLNSPKEEQNDQISCKKNNSCISGKNFTRNESTRVLKRSKQKTTKKMLRGNKSLLPVEILNGNSTRSTDGGGKLCECDETFISFINTVQSSDGKDTVNDRDSDSSWITIADDFNSDEENVNGTLSDIPFAEDLHTSSA